MSNQIDILKRLNLMDFLSCHYGLEFRHRGDGYVCLSPFRAEREPSFFIRCVNGHWLFKDFSQGVGGTIFDFVQLKENLPDFKSALSVIRRLLQQPLPSVETEAPADNADVNKSGHDIVGLYQRFRDANVSVCRDYLRHRGIAESLIDELITDKVLVHNRFRDRSYCCFAVFDQHQQLQCLDNHEIGGNGKFVLGRKRAFSCDWSILSSASEVYMTEGIIDYLSLKTLEGTAVIGLALLGKELSFEKGVVGKVERIIAALDDDAGGYSAALDLYESFPDCDIFFYPLEGHNDPNDLLVSRLEAGAKRQLSAKSKAKLYQEFVGSSNKSELARRWGIDRSYMYEVAGECEDAIVERFSNRRRGPHPAGKPKTLEDAYARIAELESAYEAKATEYEKAHCRSEFLELRLHWCEEEVAELRSDKDGDRGQSPRKRHAKKKKKNRLCH